MKYIVEANEYVQMISLIGVREGTAITITGNVDTFQNADNELDEAYQKGLHDGKARNENGCVGCMYEKVVITDNTPCECCCNAYSNKWQAKPEPDEIKVGDEVRNTLGLMDNAVGFVIGITIEGDYNVSRYIDGKIKTGTWRRENCVKTGKHSDAIVQLLAEMKGEQRNCSTCKHNRSGNAQCIDCGRFERYDMWEPKEVTE